MIGVVGVVEWTRPLPDNDGWEARATAQTVDGRIVGAGEALCSRQERNWRTRDAYQLRGMSQTRALSRALRGPVGMLITLAGYEGASAEEVPPVTPSEPPEPPEAVLPEWAQPVSDARPFLAALRRILARAWRRNACLRHRGPQ